MLSFFSFLLFKMQIKFWRKGLCYFYISKLIIIIILKWPETCGMRGYCSVLPLKSPSFDFGWNIWLPGAGGCCISQLVAKCLSQLHQLVESSHPVAGLVQGMSCTFFAAEMGIRTPRIYLWQFCKALTKGPVENKVWLENSLQMHHGGHKRVVWSNPLIWSSKGDVTFGKCIWQSKKSIEFQRCCKPEISRHVKALFYGKTGRISENIQCKAKYGQHFKCFSIQTAWVCPQKELHPVVRNPCMDSTSYKPHLRAMLTLKQTQRRCRTRSWGVKKKLQLHFSDSPTLRPPVSQEKLCDYIILNTPLTKFFPYWLEFVKKRCHSLTLSCQAFCQHRYCLFMPLLPLSQIRYCLSRHIQCKSGIKSTSCSLVCSTEMELCVSAQSELSCYCWTII